VGIGVISYFPEVLFRQSNATLLKVNSYILIFFRDWQAICYHCLDSSDYQKNEDALKANPRCLEEDKGKMEVS